MLPAVRARLHVHPGDPREPERAARLITAALLRSFPRQRPVTLAVLSLGPQPGLTPTPWLLDGVFAALVEAERTPVQWVTLGDHETGEALLHKCGRAGPVQGSELIERPSRDRRVALRVAGHRRPLSLLREVVGSSLIVVAPLCFEQSSTRSWQGPLASLLSAYAVEHGFSAPTPKLGTGLRPRADEGEGVGQALLESCLASAAVVFDATWAAALERQSAPRVGPSRGPDGRFMKAAALLRAAEPSGPTLLGELAPVDRVIGLAQLGRTSLPSLLGVDRYLCASLGLESRPSEHAPELVDSPGRWPQLSFTPSPVRSQPKRMADRAISGIRSQANKLRGATEPLALPARVPGEFASLWTRRWYGEQDLVRARVGLG